MTGATIVLSVLAIAALALIGVVVRRPETAASVGGKVLAFAALFVLPGLVLLGGAVRHYEQARTTTFCVSCHLMEPWEESLHVDDSRFLAAAHYQNRRVPADRACYTCHTNTDWRAACRCPGSRSRRGWGSSSPPCSGIIPFRSFCSSRSARDS